MSGADLREERARRRRRRSLALALGLAALALLFWLMTLMQGPNILNRTM
jgi:hypothetical protein